MTVVLRRLVIPRIFLYHDDKIDLLNDLRNSASSPSLESIYKSDDVKDQLYVLKNNLPWKNKPTGGGALDFDGRALENSVKNIQLIPAYSPMIHSDRVIFQMGNLGPNYYTVDCTYPLLPWIAFAISMTRLDCKYLY